MKRLYLGDESEEQYKETRPIRKKVMRLVMGKSSQRRSHGKAKAKASRRFRS